MKQSDLMAEVQAVVESGIANGRVVAATWITQAIVNEHRGIEGADSEWYTLCAYEHVRDTVRKVLQRYKPETGETDRQIVLPGFEQLQVAYLITRDKEQVVVPLEQMTSTEIEAKADELHSMATGCLQHERELRRYASERTEIA